MAQQIPEQRGPIPPLRPSPAGGRNRIALLAVAGVLVFASLLALVWAGTTPADAQDGYEPAPDVIADIWDYARETDNGFDHVLRWMRALHTLGAIEDMSAAEAQGHADQHLPERWDPVVVGTGEAGERAG